MVKNILFVLSGSIAFLTYIGLLLLIVWRISDTKQAPKAYTSYKETTFSISLLEISKKKNMINIPKEITQKEVKKIPIKKESASRSANSGVGVNDLFKQVESKRPVRNTKPQSTDDTIAKKRYAKESVQKKALEESLEKIMSNLELQKMLSFATPKGDFDEFYAEVQEILAKNWNPVRQGTEYSAEVEITIDARGVFSYLIKKDSGNLEFDKVLQEFLDIMQTQDFPPYKGGSKTTIMVTFKTEV